MKPLKKSSSSSSSSEDGSRKPRARIGRSKINNKRSKINKKINTRFRMEERFPIKLRMVRGNSEENVEETSRKKFPDFREVGFPGIFSRDF